MSRSLTIGVDARPVYDEVLRGTGKTIIGLYTALADARPHWRFMMFHRQAVNEDAFARFENITDKKIDIQGDRFDWWNQLRLPIGNLASRANIFHAAAGLAPRRPLVPMVSTIHDLIPIDVPSPTSIDRAWGDNLCHAAHKARHILTCSEYTKGRITELFNVAPEKITVIPWGAAITKHQPTDESAVRETRQRLGVTPGCHYVLHFGTHEVRKNTARTIDAWASLSAQTKAGWELLIVGMPNKSLPPFQEQIQALNLTDVHLQSYVSEEDVRALLAGAGLVCYPTTYEGFGLPILDAFATGTPVLCGNLTSVPEVAGDAAYLVDPHSTEAIADGLKRLIDDEPLRADLIQRGSERVKTFTWQRTAEDVARVFEEIAG